MRDEPPSLDTRGPHGTRQAAYVFLMLTALAVVGAALLMAPATFSVNDRARWGTVRALVDTGSYSIGRRYDRADRTYEDRGIVGEPGWDTVDKVMHPNTRRFYSTKPMLLPTLLAGEYWVLRNLAGWDIAIDRLAVTRTILFTINWLPFLLYLVLFARLLDRIGTTDWGRLFVFTAACFGTFVSSYLVSLNNHTIAATGALFAVYHVLRIQLDGDHRWWRFAAAGLCAGWTACNELPSAAFAAGLLLWLVRLSPGRALRIALPALLLPVAAYLWTQYLAFGSVIPTYARTEWYLYPGSYWRQPWGVDRADESTLVYAGHLLVGHTGILSLTPVLLLGWIGMVRTASRGTPLRAPDPAAPLRELSWLALAVTLVTFAFYVAATNNYGGGTFGPRWFFWLIPLWLLTMVPEADRWAGRPWLRRAACVLLAISIASTTHALANPWRHSWLFAWMQSRGWIAY